MRQGNYCLHLKRLHQSNGINELRNFLILAGNKLHFFLNRRTKLALPVCSLHDETAYLFDTVQYLLCSALSRATSLMPRLKTSWFSSHTMLLFFPFEGGQCLINISQNIVLVAKKPVIAYRSFFLTLFNWCHACQFSIMQSLYVFNLVRCVCVCVFRQVGLSRGQLQPSNIKRKLGKWKSMVKCQNNC